MAGLTSRPSSPLLPHFGIRDLNGSRSPPGIVQITSSQYDSTIHSQPDAALSYIDLDDGELITIGSSFELGQRLEEPVLHSTQIDKTTSTRHLGRSAVTDLAIFKVTAELEEKKMHIFDIRHTSGSLAVWRDHEAYSSKRLRHQDTSSSSTTTRSSSPYTAASSISKPQSTANTSTTQRSQYEDDITVVWPPSTEAPAKAASKTTAPQPAQEETPAQLDRALTDFFTGLEFHLGPLADFLDSTATGLRKIAEKTAEADTTPVENVLSGFKSILKEVGELGLEFLATLDKELEKNKSNTSSTAIEALSTSEIPPPLSIPVVKPEEPRPENKPQPDNESVTKKVSFIDTRFPIPVPPTKLKPTVPKILNREDPIQERPRFTLPPTAPLGIAQRQYSLPGMPGPIVLTSFPQPGHLDSAKGSILDSQPSDSDILTRYPPLPSLRKSASVNGLQNKPETSTQYQYGLNTTSALSRYPSIGQFEQQTHLKSRNDSDSKPVDTSNSTSGVDWNLPSEKAKKTDIYKKPTVEDVRDETTTDRPANTGSNTAWSECTKTAKWSPSKLPGAWPEPKTEDWRPILPNTTATVKPFYAPPPDPTMPSREQVDNGLSHRISSPVSETYTRAPIFPRRSQTVSGTNPAARLNGPFDPLAHIPVLKPRPQQSQPGLSAPKSVSSNAKNETSILPGVFPQRSQTIHHTDRYKPRDAAPYQYSRPTLWDNYFKNHHSTNTFPTAPSLSRPLYCNPGASRQSAGGFQGPSFHFPEYPATRPPNFTPLRPVQSMGGLRPEPPRIAQPFTTRPAPPALPPPRVPAPTQLGVAKAQPVTVNAISVPASPAAPAPMLAPAPVTMAPTTSRISRSSSVLSPCPSAFTHPRGRSGVSPPTPFASKSVDECVRSLKAMGFGSDPNERARLNVYAGAAAGDVAAAIEMIEEDREAARELEESSQISQDGSIRDFEEFDAEENPWEH